jgi:hypothetical protein
LSLSPYGERQVNGTFFGCSGKFCTLNTEASDSENNIWREEVRGGVSIVPRVMADKSHDVWAVAGADKEKRYQDVCGNKYVEERLNMYSHI